MLDVQIRESTDLVPVARSSDRRRHMRHVTVLRVAKLFTAAGEEFCLVHNISSGGMMAQVYSDHARGDRLTAEFKSGWVIPGRVAWRRDRTVGVQFDCEIDWTATLAGTDFMPLPYRARAPRVRLDARARLRLGARYRSVVIHNISQGGANLEPVEPGDVGASVVLSIGDLPAISGTVRWHDGECGGIAFDNPVPLELLGNWVAEVRERFGPANDGATFEGGPFCFPMRRASHEGAKIFRPLFFGKRNPPMLGR